MKRVLASILAFSLALLPAPLLSSVPLSASVVPISKIILADDSTSLQNGCTASSINTEAHLWLTAAHCVEEDHEMNVDKYILGDVIDVVVKDSGLDLAIIHTERAFAPALKLSRKAPVAGDPVQMIGYPLGFNSSFLTKGWIANTAFKERGDSKPYMVFQIVGAPGNSGSPVMNMDGELVSVCQFGWAASTRTFGPIAGGVTFEGLTHFVIGYF